MKKQFLLIGPPAVGGTYWTEYFVQNYPDIFSRIKTWTTRPKRDESDELYYRIESETEFLRRKNNGEFFETDLYKGFWKGSKLSDFTNVLETQCGIMKITPAGALAVLHKAYFETRIIFLHLFPKKLFLENYRKRFFKDLTSEECQEILREADTFMEDATRLLPKRASDAHIHLGKISQDLDMFKNYFQSEGIILPEPTIQVRAEERFGHFSP